MVLPSSGTIKMSDLNVEFGRSSTAEISLGTAPGGSYPPNGLNSGCSTPPTATNPDNLSEWYSYDQCCVAASSLYRDSSGTAGSDCGGGAYATLVSTVYSNNCAAMNSGCYLYTGGTGACTSVLNSYCLTDFGTYWCTNGSGAISSTGACTT